MGNVQADANGLAALNLNMDLINFPNLIGRAVIVHANPDVGQSSQPVGGAGARVAVGIIGVTNQAFPGPLVPSGVASLAPVLSLLAAVMAVGVALRA